jgi:putative flippase GtrA
VKSLLNHIRYFGTFGVASLLATLMDFTAFTLLIRQLHCPLTWAAGLGAFIGAIVHFTLCRHWVFGKNGRGVMDSGARYIIVSGTALVAHAAVTTIMARRIDPEMAWSVSKVAVFTLLTYPASRYFVFSQAPKAKTSLAQQRFATAHLKSPPKAH